MSEIIKKHNIRHNIWSVLGPNNDYFVEETKYQLLKMFMDLELNPRKAPFSIQNISKYAYENYDTKPGD